MPITTLIYTGERIGEQGSIRLGCSAVIFDETRQKVLLTQRADNGLWCLPSGGVDPGESVEETVMREVFEETGLDIRVVRLTGVYSDPNIMVMYQDGNKVQIVALNFEGEIIGGQMILSDETTDIGYFDIAELDKLGMLTNHRLRIEDTLKNQGNAFIR